MLHARRSAARRLSLRRPPVSGWLVLVAGSAAAALVGRDGSLDWQVVRVLVVVTVTAAAVVGLSRTAGAGRAGIAYLVGVVATSAGLGIGGGHVTKGDPGLEMVGGLVLYAAGLALAVGGGVGLVRAVPGWWRAPATLGVLVLTLLLVMPSWVAFYVTNAPRPQLGAATPADYGLTYRDVTVRTPDGVRLAGWYLPSGNGAAVALRPGAGSTRTAALGQAAVLARAGYGVLLTDARGHGESTGRGMDLGWYGDQDLAGAVSFLARQPDVDPARIGAVGLSMGGEEAIGAAAADPRIRAVVAEGATGRTAADQAWMSDEYGVRGTLTRGWYWLLSERVTDLLTAAEPPISLHDAVAAAAPTPMLLIAGAAMPDESPATAYIRSASPRTVQMWVVPGSGHTEGLRTEPQLWRQRVVGFLDSALAR